MKAEPWAGGKPATTCGQEFGYFAERPFASLDLADSDVDGDTLLDGEDDQDNDDISNIAELYEVVYDLDGDGFVHLRAHHLPELRPRRRPRRGSARHQRVQPMRT